MIKISVIIPLFNKEKDIINTLNSVMSQTYKADEIIVVDDGSTDNSVDVIKKYLGERVRIISQANLGVSSARNRGIKEAKNEYICLLDGDDLWEEGYLEEIKELITLYPNAIFYSTAHKFLDEKGHFLKSKISFSKDYRGIIKDFAKIFSKNYGLINSSSVCIKKSLNILFPKNEKRGEDICYWLELSLLGNLAFSAKPLSIYKLDASNRSATIHKEAIVPCPLKWFYENRDSLKENQQYKSIKNFIYSNIFITVYGGYALSKNYISIKEVIGFMRENGDKRYLTLYPAYFVPIRILNMLKYLRRKLR